MPYSLSKHHHLEPLEVIEASSADSIVGCFAEMTLSPLLSDALLSDYLSDDSCASTPTHGYLELGEAEPFDRNDLPRTVLAIDKHSVVVDDVNNDGETALLPTIVDFGDATYFDELGEGLHDDIFTIGTN
jgi:hypothetical protein